MRYVEFREAVRATLAGAPDGLTWRQLKGVAALPYERPCSTWVVRLEQEIGLVRVKGPSRAKVWSLDTP